MSRVHRLFYVSLAVLLALATVPALVMAQDVEGDAAPPLHDLSNEALWLILLGLATPFVVGVINRSYWASDIKFAVFFAFTAVTTGITVWLRGDLDTDNYLRSLLVVLASATVTYRLTKSAIKTIEVRTT